MKLSLDVVRIDGGTQARAKLSELTVDEYAEAIKAGERLPPIVACFDGSSYWVADGHHRYHAHRRAGLVEIDAQVRDGTLREARLLAASSNRGHGLRQTNEDKRSAVALVFQDQDGATWSDNEIAKFCGVSNHLVADVRASLGENKAPERTYTTKHGTKAVMKTGNIGRARKTAPDAQEAVPVDGDAPPQASPEADEEERLQGEIEHAQMKADLALLAADDKLAHLMAENKQLREQLKTVESVRDGWIRSHGAAVRQAKYWERKFLKVKP